MLCAISYHLYNIKNVKNTHGGVLLLLKPQTFLKLMLLHRCFSRSLNCRNDTKSQEVSQIYLEDAFSYFVKWQVLLDPMNLSLNDQINVGIGDFFSPPRYKNTC